MCAVVGTAGDDLRLPSGEELAISVDFASLTSCPALAARVGFNRYPQRDTSGRVETVSAAIAPVFRLAASVAQLVEQLTLNQLVPGSSPGRGTTC